MNPSAVDLTTAYLGLTLRSPLVASPSPLTGDIDSARRLAAAGVGALVLPSLFEEEIVAEELSLTAALEAGAGVNPEATNYFPPVEGATLADRYLANLERIKSAVDVPVIASLNATSVGAWSRYAELVARAGADAVELNVYRVAANPQLAAADIETSNLELISDVCAKAKVPVAVKKSGREPGGPIPLTCSSGAASAPAARASSTASISPTSTSRPWTSNAASSSRPASSWGCRCAGSPCSVPRFLTPCHWLRRQVCTRARTPPRRWPLARTR